MNKTAENTFYCLVTLLVIFPWIIGIVDMFWYIVFGAQISNMEWGSGSRAFLAIIWPFMWVLILSVIVVA